MPDYSTLCRRQKSVIIEVPFRRSGENLNLLVDSIRGKYAATANGMSISTVPADAGNDARSIWLWTHPMGGGTTTRFAHEIGSGRFLH